MAGAVTETLFDRLAVVGCYGDTDNLAYLQRQADLLAGDMVQEGRNRYNFYGQSFGTLISSIAKIAAPQHFAGMKRSGLHEMTSGLVAVNSPTQARTRRYNQQCLRDLEDFRY